MENASKALIIAGAILLSILIIGLGMMIYNNAADVIGNTGMDAQKVQTINNKFVPYTGAKVTGTNFKTLVDKVISYNLTEAEDSSQFITVTESDDASTVTTNGATSDDAAAFNTAIRTIRNGIKSGKSYKVTYGTDPHSGLIVSIGYKEL